MGQSVMSEGKSRRIGEVIGELLYKYKLDERVREQDVVLEFEHIMGTTFLKRARPVKMEHGVLFLQVESSAWRQELFYQKKMIVKKLNDHFNFPIVKNIIFT